MKSPALQYLIKPKWPVLLIIALLFCGAWGFNIYNFQFEDIPFALTLNLELLVNNTFIQTLIIFLLTILNSVLILKINKKFSIIRTRTYLPVFFYGLFILVWNSSHQLIYPHFSLSLFLLSILTLLNTYKNRKSVLSIFWTSLFTGFITIINPIFLYLMLILWLGMVMLQSFSFKTFLASIIALIIPWTYFLVYQIYKGSEIIVLDKLAAILNAKPITNYISFYDKIYLFTINIILIITLIGFYSNLLRDSIRTRKNINYFVLSLILILSFSMIFPFSLLVLMPFIAFFMAYLFAHFFSLNQSLFYTILFYIVLLFNIAYWIFNCCFL